MPRVGVLGGGLQGCCVALELASRGVPVTLVDENADLLTRTARQRGQGAPGYMYAADPSLRTARTMLAGALAFAPSLRRHLGEDLVLATSTPAAYVVHRDSQHGPDAVSGYLAAVHDLVAEAAGAPGAAYLGGDVLAPVRRWTTAEVSERFDPERAVAVFDSPEVAVDPVALAALLRRRFVHAPFRGVTRHRVESVKRDVDDRYEVGGTTGDDEWEETFNRWSTPCGAGGSRLTRPSVRPGRPWLHRLKYGVSVRWPDRLAPPPSATVISGLSGRW